MAGENMSLTIRVKSLKLWLDDGTFTNPWDPNVGGPGIMQRVLEDDRIDTFTFVDQNDLRMKLVTKMPNDQEALADYCVAVHVHSIPDGQMSEATLAPAEALWGRDENKGNVNVSNVIVKLYD